VSWKSGRVGITRGNEALLILISHSGDFFNSASCAASNGLKKWGINGKTATCRLTQIIHSSKMILSDAHIVNLFFTA